MHGDNSVSSARVRSAGGTALAAYSAGSDAAHPNSDQEAKGDPAGGGGIVVVGQSNRDKIVG